MVLIADDDRDIVRFVEVNLRLEGFQVVTAHDGEDALDKATPLHFFFNDPATTEIYTLSLHDALPIWRLYRALLGRPPDKEGLHGCMSARSEEHTSELQSHHDLVCRLLLEKKKQK